MTEFKSWNSYSAFAHRIRRESRFIRTSEDDDFFREVLRTSRTRTRKLPVGYGLWRAQLGHAWRPFYQDDTYIDDIPAAYLPDRMKPQEGRATEGRANAKGIPALYLSNRQHTAMSEVRPWLGSLVSCARFKTTRPLEIVDFSVYHGTGFILHFSEPDASKKEKSVWTQIDRAFSEPTTSDSDTADYVPTQVIAELFKSEGYDGIAYKSAFGDDGSNIALFNLADAELTHCGLYEVKSLEMSFEQNDNPYWLEPDGTAKTMSIDVIGPAPAPDSSDP